VSSPFALTVCMREETGLRRSRFDKADERAALQQKKFNRRFLVQPRAADMADAPLAPARNLGRRTPPDRYPQKKKLPGQYPPLRAAAPGAIFPVSTSGEARAAMERKKKDYRLPQLPPSHPPLPGFYRA